MKLIQIIAAVTAGLLLLVFVGVVIFRLVSPGDQLKVATLLERAALLAEPAPTPVVLDCPQPAVDQHLAELDSLIAQWDDAVELASSTSRIALSPVVNSLQTIRRDAQSLDMPPCAHFLRDLQAMFMDHEIDGFLAFMQEASDNDIQDLLQSALYTRSVFDEQLTVFRSDPQGTSDKAHEWQVLVERFQPDSDWSIIRFRTDGPDIFSIPGNWTNPVAIAPVDVTVQSQESPILINFKFGQPSDFPDVISPLVARTKLDAQGASYGVEGARTFVRFGKNTGHVNPAPENNTNTKLSGALRTPEGSVYWFDAERVDAAPLTTEEEQSIYMILASVRPSPL